MRLIIAATALLLASPMLPAVAGGCSHYNSRDQYRTAERCFSNYRNGYYGRNEAIARHQRAEQQRGSTRAAPPEMSGRRTRQPLLPAGIGLS